MCSAVPCCVTAIKTEPFGTRRGILDPQSKRYERRPICLAGERSRNPFARRTRICCFTRRFDTSVLSKQLPSGRRIAYAHDQECGSRNPRPYLNLFPDSQTGMRGISRSKQSPPALSFSAPCADPPSDRCYLRRRQRTGVLRHALSRSSFSFDEVHEDASLGMSRHNLVSDIAACF